MLFKVELRCYLNKVVFLGPFTVHMYEYILQIIFFQPPDQKDRMVL